LQENFWLIEQSSIFKFTQHSTMPAIYVACHLVIENLDKTHNFPCPSQQQRQVREPPVDFEHWSREAASQKIHQN